MGGLNQKRTSRIEKNYRNEVKNTTIRLNTVKGVSERNSKLNRGITR